MYEQLKMVVEMTKGKVPAHQAWNMVDNPWDKQQYRNILRSRVPIKIYKAMKADTIPEEEMDKYINTPAKIYDFFQSLEAASVAIENSYDDPDRSPERETIGFVADFEDMVRINPNQIAIIQVVARKGAHSNHVNQERELRFSPEDLKIIRWEQP